jgi:acyl carrier protein
MDQAVIIPVRDRLIEMVKRTLTKNAVERPFSINDQLAEIGLTSIDMVNLLFDVEAEFDVTIPQHELTPENFETIAVIEGLMARLDPGLQA